MDRVLFWVNPDAKKKVKKVKEPDPEKVLRQGLWHGEDSTGSVHPGLLEAPEELVVQTGRLLKQTESKQ